MGFADDCGALGTTVSAVSRATELTEEFAVLTKQELSVRKSFTWATTACMRRRAGGTRIAGKRLPRKPAGRVLGAQLRFGKRAFAGLAGQRVIQGTTRARRLRHAPLPMEAKLQMMQTAISPLAFHGIQAGSPTLKQRDRLRAELMRAWWGPKRAHRAQEMAWVLYTRGHKVDPMQAIPYARIHGMRRSLVHVPRLRPIFLRIWDRLRGRAPFVRSDEGELPRHCVLGTGGGP